MKVTFRNSSSNFLTGFILVKDVVNFNLVIMVDKYLFSEEFIPTHTNDMSCLFRNRTTSNQEATQDLNDVPGPPTKPFTVCQSLIKNGPGGREAAIKQVLKTQKREEKGACGIICKNKKKKCCILINLLLMCFRVIQECIFLAICKTIVVTILRFLSMMLCFACHQI